MCMDVLPDCLYTMCVPEAQENKKKKNIVSQELKVKTVVNCPMGIKNQNCSSRRTVLLAKCCKLIGFLSITCRYFSFEDLSLVPNTDIK